MKSSKRENLPFYRHDIDGLRGLAVLLVILFHAFPEILPGGYIGVDIFFVISGYLISSNLIKSHESNSFDLLSFYGKRIRRIFPALITVLVTSLIVGWFFALPSEYWMLGRHTAGSSIFLLNFFLWHEAGYFDTIANTKPLLHLWSLAIEEQFYVFWPLLFWLAWKVRSYLFCICAIIALISFLFNLWTINADNNLTAAFYSPLTRCWELIIGAMLAIIERQSRLYPKNIQNKCLSQCNKHKSTTSILGILFLILGVVIINKSTAYPGAWALFPTIGAFLIISSSPKGLINRTLLSNRLMIGLGLISYSLYLWHWPILAFLRITQGQTPLWWVRIGGLIASLLMATLTFYLIEQPMRYGKFIKYKTIALIFLLAIVGAGGYNIYKRDGLGFRKNILNYEQTNYEGGNFKRTLDSDGSCMLYLGFDLKNPNTCITNSNHPELLIIGDSHAMALSNAIFNDLITKKVLLIAAHTCPLLKGMRIEEKGLITNPQCEQLPNLIIEKLNGIKSINTILLTTRGPYYFSGHNTKNRGSSNIKITNPEIGHTSQEELFFLGTNRLLEDLNLFHKRIIYLIDVPELEIDPSNCFINRPGAIKGFTLDKCTSPISKVLERQKEYRKIIFKLQSRFQKMVVVDSIDNFCDKIECFSSDRDGTWYHDDNHISTHGSKRLINHIFNDKDFLTSTTPK